MAPILSKECVLSHVPLKEGRGRRGAHDIELSWRSNFTNTTETSGPSEIFQFSECSFFGSSPLFPPFFLDFTLINKTQFPLLTTHDKLEGADHRAVSFGSPEKY